MERKYKQRGYMEEQSEGVKREKTQRPAKSGIKHFGMRNGGTARSGIRCALCGKTVTMVGELTMDSTCDNCGTNLHTCKNCAFFNTSSRWECTKPILVRIARKDIRNECTFYSPAVFVERTFESGSDPAPQDARKAFDALFKK
jgi:hypothetical protein